MLPFAHSSMGTLLLSLLIGHTSSLQVHTSSYIAECGDDDGDCVRQALQLDGAVALDVPGMASARMVALTATAKCLASTPMGRTTLPDGTSRATIGSHTVRGVSGPLEGCHEAEDETAAMRALVNQASVRFLELVQPLMRSGSKMLRTNEATPYTSLADLARAGEQLEHFHAYRASEAAPSSGNRSPASAASSVAVPLHTDAGLFIAIVPALRLISSDEAAFSPLAETITPDHDATGSAEMTMRDGFLVQRWDGSEARIRPRPSAPPVVFVIGEGWSTWINPLLSSPLRAAPHAMMMPRQPSVAGTVRSWYGRMFLTPSDAVLHRGAPPFREWRRSDLDHILETAALHSPLANETARAAAEAALSRSKSHVAVPTGCAGGRRFLAMTNPVSCGENEISCWMQCMKVDADVEATCGAANAVCATPDGVPHDQMCKTCTPQCLAPPPSPPAPPAPPGGYPSPPPVATAPKPFCHGGVQATDMHMQGFVAKLGEAEPSGCVILLFEPWVLDSALAFAFGVLGIFALGFLTEGLTFLRREHLAKAALLRTRPMTFRFVMAFIFTVQVTLGYFLMLAAMTYQAELFVAVMLGLGIGHLTFNVTAPVGDSVDACCVDPCVATSAAPRPPQPHSVNVVSAAAAGATDHA